MSSTVTPTSSHETGSSSAPSTSNEFNTPHGSTVLEAVRSSLVCSGNGSVDGDTVDVVSPVTGDVWLSLPQSTPADVREAAARARAAQRGWAARPLHERTRVARRLHTLILDRAEDIADIIGMETGKARRSAMEEVADVAMTALYYAKSAKRHLGPHRRKAGFPILTHTVEQSVPKGLVGMITPWNYPLTIPISDAIAALLAGNAVVIKPDTQTTLSALWGMELLVEAGLPRDLFLAVTGNPAQIGEALITESDYVAFTGSTATGTHVATECAKRLIGCSVELGGKNPMIVLPDAPLDRAANSIVQSAFSNAGQLCMSIERIYVHRDVFDDFLDKAVDTIKHLTLGVGLDYEFDIGSLVSTQQLERVSAHVEDAVAHGATVHVGGTHRPDIGPYVFEPTLLTGVDESMALCREETFGPVIALYPVDSDDEAIMRANDSDYGLNASVWGSVSRATPVAHQIEAGSVNINEGFTATWTSHDAPMGGFKRSGLGRRHGREGITRFTESRTVSTQRLITIDRPETMSNKDFAQLMLRGLRLLRYLP